jgi:hypothetical protein
VPEEEKSHSVCFCCLSAFTKTTRSIAAVHQTKTDSPKHPHTTMAAATTIIPAEHHFRVDAMSEANITKNQAVNYCVLTLDTRHPTAEEIEAATTTLTNMRLKIIKMGEEELKSLFVAKAAVRGVKFKGNVVSNWSDLRGAWNSDVSLILCKDLYDIMICFFITDGEWMTNKAREIKERLGIVIDSSNDSDTSTDDDCFVLEILRKKCHPLVWKTFGANRKKAGHGVGLTQKKALKNHPMGDMVSKDCKTNKFFFQNVQNWEVLCAKDPVARMIQEMRDLLPVGDVSAVCYQDVSWCLKKQARESSNKASKTLLSRCPAKEASWPLSDDDNSEVPNECGGPSKKNSNTLQGISAFRPQHGTVEKATAIRKAPDSIVTAYRHVRSPAVITTSTRLSDSPLRKTLRVSAKDATNDSDIITGTRTMLQVQIDDGVFETQTFGDLSTLRPSLRTEVLRSLFLLLAIIPVFTLLTPPT